MGTAWYFRVEARRKRGLEWPDCVGLQYREMLSETPREELRPKLQLPLI